MMGVIEWLCDIRFHRSFILQPNSEISRTKPLRISYADYGDKNSDAVVLICGALMGTRFCYSPIDELAKANRVRIIHPDRPGIGGSDPVEQHERIAIWLEIVPQLLDHLGISSVALASHSGGVIYALNTMLSLPHILHPKTPYITLFAPWVHHSHTGISKMRATELLPVPLIGKFDSVARFVNDNVIPLAGLSSGFLSGIKDTFQHSSPSLAPLPLAPSISSRPSSIISQSGPQGLALEDPTVVEELRQLAVKYIFAESTDGVSADAQLFLKRPHTTSWCIPSIPWSDMDSAVQLLEKMVNEHNEDRNQSRKWKIDAFHAESDGMVGDRGRAWFDECWTTPNPSAATSSEQSGSGIEYKSEIVGGSDHDYLMDPAFGASEKWLQRVRDAFPLPSQVEV